MKKLVLLFLIAFSISAYSQEAGINFGKDSLLSEALIRSKKEGKLLFIDCYTTWCGPCKALSKNIFTQKEVGDFYNSHFINIKFDMEKADGLNVRKKYGVQAFPTLLFLNAKGEIVHLRIGGGSAEQIIELGKTALDDTRNIQSLVKKMKAGDKTAETLTSYLQANEYANDKDALLNGYFAKASSEEKLSKPAWELFKSYVNDINNLQFKYFIQNRKSYELKYGKEEVEDKIMDVYRWCKADQINLAKSIDSKLYDKFLLRNKAMQSYSAFQRKKTDKTSWDNFIADFSSYLSEGGFSAMDYNTICWSIYENYKTFSDIEALKKAKEWLERAYKIMPDNHPINDTYSHILFDLGYVKEAIEHEELAIKKATEENSTNDLVFYNTEIERFKKKLTESGVNK